MIIIIIIVIIIHAIIHAIIMLAVSQPKLTAIIQADLPYLGTLRIWMTTRMPRGLC